MSGQEGTINKILITDNNEDNLGMLCTLLEGRGYEAVPARNGSEALEKARCTLPDLIISDILMPQMDGFRFCLEIKQDEKLRTTPFIFYAAPYADQEDEKLAMALGASLFIYKPISPDKFLNIISEVIHEHKKQETHVPGMPPAVDAYILRVFDEYLVVKLGKGIKTLNEKHKELLKTREKLYAIQEKHRNIFKNMRDVIIIADQEGNIIDANELSLEKMFGYDLEGIKGKKTKVLYAGAGGCALAEEPVLYNREFLQNNIMKADFRKKSGQVFKGELYSFNIVNEKGEVNSNISVIRDIEEYGKVEERLGESEQKYRQLLSMVADPIMLFDAGTRQFIEVNKACVNLYGYSEEEFIGLKYENIAGDPVGPGVFINKALKDGSKKILHHRKKDGTQFPVEISLNALNYRGRKVLCGVIRDITPQKKAEEQAARPARLAALGELAAGVAHEVNNPINGIINYAQMIVNTSGGSGRVYDLASRIINEGDRIAHIAGSLLSFARAGDGEKRPVHLAEIMSDSLLLIDAQMKKDGIKTGINVPRSLPDILARPQQIEQVFLNIISNARYALNKKYPGAHKYKVLQIVCNEVIIDGRSHVCISFLDFGMGIPDEIIDKIMNPFFTTKPGGVGTGLGLSISHGIIDDHGGRILIDSVNGEYTKVIIEIPAYVLNSPSGKEEGIVHEISEN